MPDDLIQQTSVSVGARRAASILVAIGGESARDMFRQLGEVEIRRIAQAARGLGRASVTEVESALDTFIDALEGLDADLKAGDAVLRQVAASALGEDVARRAFDVVAPAPVDEALGSVTQADPETLAMVLGREQPQTVALVLGVLDPDRAAEVLDYLPEDGRPEILRRMATVEAVSPEVLREVGAALAGELQSAMAGGLRRVEGRVTALALLRRSSRDHQEEVLRAIEQDDPELAGELRAKLFTFEDLLNLTDRDIQLLLKDVDSKNLVVALKGATPSILDKLLRNMSSRAAELVQDDLSAMGPTRLDVVEQAQNVVVQIALRLAEQGKITIVRPSDRLV